MAKHTTITLVFPQGTPMDDIDEMVLDAILEHSNDNQAQTARLLGISSRTVARRLAKKSSEGAEIPVFSRS